MISIQELASYFYRANSRYCGGTSQIDQDLFMEKLMDYLNQEATLVLELRPSGKAYYDYDFSGDSRMGPFDQYDTPSSAIWDALRQGKNIVLIFYKADNSLDKICRVIDRANSYLYVQVYTDESHKYTSSPSLSIYSFYYSNALKKVTNPVSTGWIFDISDIFNTPPDSADWGKSEMDDKMRDLRYAISSNSFFSVQQDKEQLPVRVFRKTVAGEFADEVQYDLYKFINFSKWEHLRITTHHLSSGSTSYTYKVSKEIREAGPYDVSWITSYNPGDALPDEQVEELISALEDHRQIFIKNPMNEEGSDFAKLSLQGILEIRGEEIRIILTAVRGSDSPELFYVAIDNYIKSDSTWSIIVLRKAALLTQSSLKTLNGQSLVGAGDIVTDKAVISALPDVFGGTSAEFFANLKELYDAGTLKLNNIYYGNTELTDIVAGLAVQEMRIEVLPGDGGQVVFSAVATTSTYDDSLRPFRWETQSLNGGFTKWVGRATQDSIPTKVSELANDAGYVKAAPLETITDASEISVTCESGKTYQGNNIMTLAIGCSASDNSTVVEERIVFSTGSSVESITVNGVSWANGDTPSFKANKVYEISVSYVPLLGKFLATYAEY